MKKSYNISLGLLLLITVLTLSGVIKGNIAMGVFFLIGGFFMSMTSWDKKSKGEKTNCIVAAILSFFSISIGILILLVTMGMYL